jgi:phosphohistidine phosphatase SixA
MIAAATEVWASAFHINAPANTIAAAAVIVTTSFCISFSPRVRDTAELDAASPPCKHSTNMSGSTLRGLFALALMAATSAAFSVTSIAQSGVANGLATVILVRHAEKAPTPLGGDDPQLSAAGEIRAHALVETLRDAGVTSIITTHLRRTRQTAAPVAAALGRTPEIVRADVPPSKHIEALKHAVESHSGEVVLVVGHANTVPRLIAALGGPQLPEICDATYDDFFTVFLAQDKIRFIHARYGAPSPRGAPECP